MGMEASGRMLARAQIAGQIDALEGAAPRDRLKNLNALRSTAQAYDMQVVADLAGHLKRALERGSGKVSVGPYIDALYQALGCERADPNAAQLFATVINQRLYG